MALPRLYFLGRPHFEQNQQALPDVADKAVVLLAFLALSGSPQPRERLLGLLWAESAEEAARKNLRNTLWRIRRSLGSELLVSQDERLALAAGVWVDVQEFERLTPSSPQAAVTLYQGPLLDGLALSGAPEWELWLTSERERLAQLYLRALGAMVNLHRSQPEWREVAAVARRALAHDNLQEPMHRAIMEAHARLGERAEALRQYDALQAILAQELGVAPLAETVALREAILSQAWRPVGSPRSQPPLRRRPAATLETAPFVGRQAELALLNTELDRVLSQSEACAATQTRVVLLTGEVGIGKSRLWREWSTSLAAGGTLLESRCLASTQALPFAPLTELFNSQPAIRRLLAAGSPIPSIWLAEVARLLPELRLALPELPAPAALPPEEERRRLFEAFAQCLLALGTRPLIFFIDDLHWADQATLEWLDYLVHRLRDQALLLVAAYRPEEAPAALTHLVASWGREGLAQRLALTRLTYAEAATLLATLIEDPALRNRLAHRLLAQSAGNPYFLIELARALPPGEVPPVLADLLRARLDRLPDSTRQVLQAAAILEPEFDFHTLRRTSGRDEEETLDALDALIGAAVLVEQASHYTFTHPLLALVARDRLSGARRAFLHRRAAAALESAPPARLPQLAGRLVEHYLQAGEPGRAAHHAQVAAERALDLAAPAEASRFYRQALALEPTPARQMGLGRALLWQSEREGAYEAFLAAQAGYEAAGDLWGAARACLNRGEVFFTSGRFDDGRRWLEKGLSYVAVEGSPEYHALAHMFLGSGGLADGELSETHLSEAVRLAVEHNLPEIGARTRFLWGNLLAERGDFPQAVQMFHSTLAFARAAGDPYLETLAHNNAAYHALLAGDLTLAHEQAAAGLALAEARGLHLSRQYLYSTHGEIALAENRLDEAADWFERGLAEAERYGNQTQAANYRANQALVARAKGDLDGALALLQRADEAARDLPAVHLQTQIDL